MNSPLLQTLQLRKSFGALAATDGVDFDVREGETHAVIGPNGAGKTTFIKQLSGELRPDSGQVRFGAEDITALPAPQRARRGLARSFQITSIYRDFSALDNVALAVQAQAGHSFQFWKAAREDRALTDPALHFLEQVFLDKRAAELAANLSHGEQRQLEVAMALATQPRLLLLDEPMAGMGTDESQRMIALLASLKDEKKAVPKTIVLVEHDMDAVFTLADRISVLVYGRIIATGTPAEIRVNTEVRSAYLGEDG
jgi:branched-chain amino acid transport system ATP-binding protein